MGQTYFIGTYRLTTCHVRRIRQALHIAFMSAFMATHSDEEFQEMEEQLSTGADLQCAAQNKKICNMVVSRMQHLLCTLTGWPTVMRSSHFKWQKGWEDEMASSFYLLLSNLPYHSSSLRVLLHMLPFLYQAHLRVLQSWHLPSEFKAQLFFQLHLATPVSSL